MFTYYAGIFTARVRSTREGNIYTWECLSVHHCGGGAGYPIPGLGGVPPSQVWWWGVPHPRSGQGVPHPRSGRGVGYPIPWQGGTWGNPPDQVWMGYPPGPGTGYPPDLGWGTPPDLGWGTPQTWDRGTPPA